MSIRCGGAPSTNRPGLSIRVGVLLVLTGLGEYQSQGAALVLTDLGEYQCGGAPSTNKPG